MKKQTNINAVLAMVASYLEDEIDRMELELDVPYELEKRYRRMVAEDRQFAELIYDRIIEDGINCADHLSDAQLKDLIRRQYEYVLDIAAGGFC